jgi:hypothetical protein
MPLHGRSLSECQSVVAIHNDARHSGTRLRTSKPAHIALDATTSMGSGSVLDPMMPPHARRPCGGLAEALSRLSRFAAAQRGHFTGSESQPASGSPARRRSARRPDPHTGRRPPLSSSDSQLPARRPPRWWGRFRRASSEHLFTKTNPTSNIRYTKQELASIHVDPAKSFPLQRTKALRKMGTQMTKLIIIKANDTIFLRREMACRAKLSTAETRVVDAA